MESNRVRLYIWCVEHSNVNMFYARCTSCLSLSPRYALRYRTTTRHFSACLLISFIITESKMQTTEVARAVIIVVAALFEIFPSEFILGAGVRRIPSEGAQQGKEKLVSRLQTS